MKTNLLQLFILLGLLSFSQIYAESRLYPQEKMVEINNTQTLYRYIEGSNLKPLVVFIPGDANLARISYGFPGGKEEDFLGYWIHKKDYPFVGISYPNDNLIYSKIYPTFNIREWGKQVTELIKQLIEQNQLSNHVVILGWNTGGLLEESVAESLQKNRIILDQFIGLSALPPLPTVLTGNEQPVSKILPNHLLDRKTKIDFFSKQLAEQNQLNGREIIPEGVYLADFVGNIPVALLGEGYFYEGGRFQYHLAEFLNDSGVFYFENTPWLGFIDGDSATTAKISLIDSNGWNYIRSQMIYKQYVFYTNIESNVNKFAVTKRILNQVPTYFMDSVRGNNLFFVGKKGARETAQKVELLIQKINTTKQNLVKLALD